MKTYTEIPTGNVGLLPGPAPTAAPARRFSLGHLAIAVIATALSVALVLPHVSRVAPSPMRFPYFGAHRDYLRDHLKNAHGHGGCRFPYFGGLRDKLRNGHGRCRWLPFSSSTVEGNPGKLFLKRLPKVTGDDERLLKGKVVVLVYNQEDPWGAYPLAAAMYAKMDALMGSGVEVLRMDGFTNEKFLRSHTTWSDPYYPGVLFSRKDIHNMKLVPDYVILNDPHWEKLLPN